ncbi:PQQ-dependent sugar dehydrogenase [Asticcacaulis sp. AND118]|uniref:PQQ-dependent sugar dehydrogenase n=1 Tax=Asticcacaulis sp. AND118 TaxID=2840468 RepID=UPI001CFFA61E|nr:PQQ-dependent sugar dehydrogenase [Asticcacaulis sp. AND118]UDF03710.1 PQQ-dependent sugar dehydrogenase [Asticcacaulis sp. AND118]
MSRIPLAVVLSLGLSLAACGGDDSGGGGGGGGAPSLSFTSGGTASFGENGTGTAYTAAATGGSGAITYSLGSGGDNALFSIDGTSGALTFKAAPNFEWPRDSNRDNIYDVTVTASAGGASASRTVAVTVTDRSGRVALRRVGEGFTQPLFVTGRGDNSGKVLVVQKGGLVRVLDPLTGVIDATAFLDVRDQIATDGERGLLGLALAPDFSTTGVFYAYLTATNGAINIRRYTATAAGASGAGDTLLTIAHPANNHNGGWIAFDKNGLLVAAVGDGGGGGDPSGNAQNTNVLLGKILRIDVRSDAYPADPNRDYAIPMTNPFASMGGAPEIWHWGLRNPFRNSFDRETGHLYIGDVGQSAIEEINFASSGSPGLNYGWNILEGTSFYAGGSTTGLTPPVAQYAQGTGPLQGKSVTGGYVYRGPVVSMRAQYVFGDFVNKRMWSIPVANMVQGTTLANTAFTDRTTAFAPSAGAVGSITSFGEDDFANLYVVDFDGEIFLMDEVDEGA